MHSQSEPRTFAAVKAPISREALDQLFREARTHSAWFPEPVPVELLRKAYELARRGPTSANASPARFVFLTTAGAKALVVTENSVRSENTGVPITCEIMVATTMSSLFVALLERVYALAA